MTLLLGLAAPGHPVVAEQSPRLVNFPGAPRGPSATTTPFGALSAGEPPDFHVDLPGYEAQVTPCISPAEVVHPASDKRVDDALHDLDYRHVQAFAHRLA